MAVWSNFLAFEGQGGFQVHFRHADWGPEVSDLLIIYGRLDFFADPGWPGGGGGEGGQFSQC